MKPPFKIDPIPSLLPTGGLQYLKNLFFPKRNQLAAVNRQLEVDIHAHWLPGVDDGAQTEEEGLSLVRGLVELGYSKLVATPHIKADHYNNDPIKLGKVFSKFKKAVKAAGINVELGLAAEYMLDDGFIKHLEDNNLLAINGNLVLIEMSPLQLFPALEEILTELKRRGYQPVLAHPERYGYYFKNWSALEALKEQGCYFQLNALSPAGYYGRYIGDRARAIMDRNWYEFVGTDIHNEKQLQYLAKVSYAQAYHNSELL
ncbi:MAG: hypothetical protein H6562_19015 [Lewinellaceae bacterium]|nr:hypothetical protein [Lewinella sp.]MCB9280988.1 hypothetical protein [Lewinellaceae bacterium]